MYVVNITVLKHLKILVFIPSNSLLTFKNISYENVTFLSPRVSSKVLHQYCFQFLLGQKAYCLTHSLASFVIDLSSFNQVGIFF